MKKANPKDEKVVSASFPANEDAAKKYQELSEAFKADRQKLVEAGQPLDARVDQFLTEVNGIFQQQ